jgi:two-component system, NarL family, response regulator NreC
MIRILLIEDHIILRDGLRSLLDMEDDLEVIGEAATGDEGLRIAASEKPDVVITDIGLPGRSGLSIIPELRSGNPNTRILVLTAHCTDEYVRAALEAGADGYVLKDATRLDLINGIHSIAAGQKYFSTPVASKLVSGYLGILNEAEAGSNSKITQREKQVLKLVASAYSNKSIATTLGLSIKTVEKHRSNLMRKLGLHSTAAVTLYAIRQNLISTEEVPTKQRTDL